MTFREGEDATARVTVDELVDLSHRLGNPDAEFAILAEGNVSGRSGSGLMTVKASGVGLRDVDSSGFVQVEIEPVMELIAASSPHDTTVATRLEASKVRADAPHPSVETLLHAVALTAGHAMVVAHTHPTAVNAILCSDQAETLIAGALFPDQIVVLGRHQLLLPYSDPGLALGRATKVAIERFENKHGERVKAIYVRNHGLFALGDTCDEALRITAMADKTARVLLGALAIGRPVYLSPADADRIHTRPDELYRRQTLSSRR